jgi:hypothetical protein
MNVDAAANRNASVPSLCNTFVTNRGVSGANAQITSQRTSRRHTAEI